MPTTVKPTGDASAVAPSHSNPSATTTTPPTSQKPTQTWEWRTAHDASTSEEPQGRINIPLHLCIHKQFHPDHVHLTGSTTRLPDTQLHWDKLATKKLHRDHQNQQKTKNQSHGPCGPTGITAMLYHRRITDAAGAWLSHVINASTLHIIAPPHTFTTSRRGGDRSLPDGEHITVAFRGGGGGVASASYGRVTCHVYLERDARYPARLTILQVTRMNGRRMEYLVPVC